MVTVTKISLLVSCCCKSTKRGDLWKSVETSWNIVLRKVAEKRRPWGEVSVSENSHHRHPESVRWDSTAGSSHTLYCTWMFRTIRRLTPMCVSVAVTRLACSSSFHNLNVLLWKARIHQQPANKHYTHSIPTEFPIYTAEMNAKLLQPRPARSAHMFVLCKGLRKKDLWHWTLSQLKTGIKHFTR